MLCYQTFVVQLWRGNRVAVPTSTESADRELNAAWAGNTVYYLHVIHFAPCALCWYVSIRGLKTSFHLEQTRRLLRNLCCSLNFTGIQCVTFGLFLKCYISKFFMISFQTAQISKQSLVKIYKTTNRTSANTQCDAAAAVTFWKMGQEDWNDFVTWWVWLAAKRQFSDKNMSSNWG